MRTDQVLTGLSPPQQSNAVKDFLKDAGETIGNGVQFLRDISNSHHSVPLHAFIRQGADEIAQILPAFPDSVKTSAEMGQIFENTAQEVFLNKTGRELEIDMGN